MLRTRVLAPLLGLLLLGSGGALGQGEQDQSDFAADATRLLAEAHARSRAPAFQGAVATRDGLVWSSAAGLADVADGVDATTETRFGIGSISKSLTMVLALRLAERGVIDLDAPIETYLPGYPHAGRGVTIRRIATHLSGLSDEIGTSLRTTTRHFDTPSDAYEVLRDEPLVAEPGERHAYVTGPYTLIGAAIERATGERFEDLVRTHVLEPAGMRRTVANDRTRDIEGVSAFYVTDDDGEPVEHAPYDPSYKLPGAGYLSTASDLCRFGTALLEGGMVERGVLEGELWANAVDASGEPTGFGLGFRIDELEDGTPAMHQPGGGIGISGWLFVFPEEGVSVAVLSNQTGAPSGGRETFEIIERALDAHRAGELEARTRDD